MDPFRLVAAIGRPRRLLVVGGASLDVLYVDGTPTPAAGGAGLYTALAAARAGAEVTMLAPRPDPMPDLLAPALDLIRWIGPTVSPEELPRFEIGYGPGGEVSGFDAFMGAEPDMTPDLLDEVGELPGWVYCVPFLDAGLQLDFVRTVRGRGSRVVAGTYGCAARADTATVRRTAALADAFFCNEDEAEVLFGSSGGTRTEPGRLLFVTRGPRGVGVYQGDHGTDVPGVAVSAVDPTGAGDTFCGATTVRLMAGDHPVEAARHGVAAAAGEVTGVGPQRLLDGDPPPPSPSDGRARVCIERVGSLAALIRSRNDFEPFSFTGEVFPPPEDPAALDVFFAATLQQFGFWRERDGRWSEPMVARIAERTRKGSDYLWAAYLRWASIDPAGLAPAGQAAVTEKVFSERLADDAGIDPIPASATAAALAASYGDTMQALEWTPALVVAAAAETSRPMGALLVLLDHIGGYREDPLRKKSALLGVILRQRPEAWLPDTDGDDAPPIVDYHVQRTCLRTGMVEVLDEELRARIVQRRVLPAGDEEAIRRAAFAAVARLAEESGRSMGAVDWFLFGMRHRCPETTIPECDRCPAEPACARRIELFQPVRRTTFY